MYHDYKEMNGVEDLFEMAEQTITVPYLYACSFGLLHRNKKTTLHLVV